MPQPILYFVRHGETSWNIDARLQGQCDIDLTSRGREQAVISGEILRTMLARENRDPSALDYISSPLVRARHTMELIRGTLGLETNNYRLDPDLKEISFGQWEGFTIPEMREIDPDGVARRERDKWNFVPPDGESYQQLSVRVENWYRRTTRDTVVVAHGGTARALFVLFGIAPTDTAASMDVDQGVVYRMSGAALTRHA